MDDIDLKEVQPDQKNGATITVVGAGGCGSNMIGHLIKLGFYNDHSNVRLVVANTDVGHLESNPSEYKIILGAKTSNGLGAGGKPDVGKKAAEESEEKIKDAIRGSDIVIVSAGLGGGTGTGASPVIARIARSMEILTVAVVTKPFKHEGKKRAQIAEEWLEELKENVDSIILIPNDKLLSIVNNKAGYEESMKIVDDMLLYVVRSICNIILNHSGKGINVDFQDVKTVMGHKGLSLVSIGEASGEKAAENAVKNAIHSPLFDNISINNFKGLIVNFEMNGAFPMQDVSDATDMLTDMGSDEADVMWGTMLNDEMSPDHVIVSLIVTGFEGNTNSLNAHKPSVSISQMDNSNAKNDDNQVSSTGAKSIVDLTNVIRRVSNGDFNDSDLDDPAYTRYSKD